MKYVLITSARNEEAFIKKTLDSVVAQTVLPERWVIVDDGSTDRTAEIVEDYAKRFPWIELVRRSPDRDRNFASKAHAVNMGLERTDSLQFQRHPTARLYALCLSASAHYIDASTALESERDKGLLASFRQGKENRREEG